MTNPDREELVKLAAELGAMSMRLSYEQDRMTVISACELLRRLASSDSGEVSRIVEAAQDIVALWDSPKIQGLPRAERNSAIEDSRAALIDAVHELARSSVGSEQGSSNSKVAGSNPAAPANNVPVAKLVEAPDLNSGRVVGSNPTGDTIHATEAHQVEQLFCKQSVAGSNPARGTNIIPVEQALEPVAWRWRGYNSTGPFTYSDTEPERHSDYPTEPLYTAPPADAGMREAYSALCLPRESQASDNLEGALYDIERLSAQGKPTDDICIRTLKRVLKQIVRAEDALTAPGATTKSDGGAKAGSSPILASKEDQRSDTHGMMPVGDNAANIGSTGVGPSDSSSTRSEVTIESVAYQIRLALVEHYPAMNAVIRESVGDAAARALLNQFEIRRK